MDLILSEQGSFATRVGLVPPSVALNRPFVLPAAAREIESHAVEVAQSPRATLPQSPPTTSGVVPEAPGANLALALQTTRYAGEILRQGYRIGNLGILVGYDEASELSELLPIFRLPGVAAWVRGLVNLHGNIVPVFDLAVLLAVDQTKTAAKAKSGVGLADTMLLVLGHAEASAAVLIDGVPERKRFRARDQMESAIVPDALRNYVRAVYADPLPEAPEGTMAGHAKYWIELDHARFFQDMMPRML